MPAVTTKIGCLSPNGSVETTSVGPLETLFVGTLRGMYVFTRSGDGWNVEGPRMAERHFSSLLYEPNSKLLFGGCHGYGEAGGLYASADQGRTWEKRTNGLTNDHVYTIARAEQGGRVTLYAGTEPPALFRSDDLGQSWTELPALRGVPGTDKWTFPPPPHIAHVKCMTVDPKAPDTLYVLVEQGALLKTTDGGKSWKELDAYSKDSDTFYRDVHRVVVSPADRNHIHLASGDGLYYSADGGQTWTHQQTRKDRIGYPDALFLDPNDDSTLYMGGAGDAPETWRRDGTANPGFIVSRDRGKTWKESMSGFAQPVHGNLEAFAMHSWPGGLAFYAGSAVGDVYSSEDGGKTWKTIATGLPPISKARHYRHFLSEDDKKRIENEGKAERRAQGLTDKEYAPKLV